MVEIGKKLRNMRISMLRSPEEIASLLSVSMKAYSRMERGLKDINVTQLTKLAAFYNVKAGAILDEKNPLSPEPTEEAEKVMEKLNDSVQMLNYLQQNIIVIQKEINEFRDF